MLIAKDNSAADGVIVALYPEDSINAIKRSKPFYFAKTDKAGNFQINNIKSGNYRIFALKDQNYNYIYDQPNELIAFSDSIMHLTDTLPKTVQLNLFEEAGGKVSFTDIRSIRPGLLQICFSRPVKTFSLESELKSEQDFYYFYPTKDTIIYWYSNFYIKKTMLFLVANDTLRDTVRMKLKNIPIDSLIGNSKHLLNIVNQQIDTSFQKQNKNNYNTQELYKPLKISFTRPVIKINEHKPFHLYEDSVRKDLTAQFSIDEKTKLFILFDFEKKKTHRTRSKYRIQPTRIFLARGTEK